MEQVDILDNQGNQTGEIRTLNDVHIHGLWHRTAHVWVVNSRGEILLQHRHSSARNFPEMWDTSVGGHMSAGDTSMMAAIRETKEEIGIDITEKDLKYIGEVIFQARLNNDTYLENEFNDIYLITLDVEISDLTMQYGEVKDLKWVTVEEFQKMISAEPPVVVPHGVEYDLLLQELEK